MTNNYYQKYKKWLQNEPYERYQNLSKEEKHKRQKNAQEWYLPFTEEEKEEIHNKNLSEEQKKKIA